MSVEAATIIFALLSAAAVTIYNGTLVNIFIFPPQNMIFVTND